jgi:hypothetical protein
MISKLLKILFRRHNRYHRGCHRKPCDFSEVFLKYFKTLFCSFLLDFVRKCPDVYEYERKSKICYFEGLEFAAKGK